MAPSSSSNSAFPPQLSAAQTAKITPIPNLQTNAQQPVFDDKINFGDGGIHERNGEIF